ncbi:TetR/AcrR family transcriptional regulator [Apilactobacillus micheneri]|uniref:TetR/AcrR family transcriptional regulator n=1 Tax=Apilactobacillus micheneri TaxID=1899430 RepID=A0A9Q8MTR0_9LACO|nr:TetR/AcrR family transcriptional regulator [Apilactobacillus micheneri]TPR39949.1 TetR/AcrR family transcriptional regulator [Apilactobacillus micheneri]TPR41762.1 TetR/AcrR family transcriptional regulator [Apilactobacillus micheneri]TPR44151.1 TetR/AcrR family transcriptional regulator [Apilactobacillus micheneri]TPR45775.1 TetR/AcrR family transcriptional regulator [Apilactobacillus micheneri]
MRYKDKNKLKRIFKATLDLVNQQGLSETSVSKIANRASTSSSTIYVYFENKEDLLIKLYTNVKKEMMREIYDGVDNYNSFKKQYENSLLKFIQYISENPSIFLFIEQFNNSPVSKKIPKNDLKEILQQHYDFYKKGKDKEILKNIDIELLIIFTHYPAMQFVKEVLAGEKELNDNNIYNIITMSWNAVKA